VFIGGAFKGKPRTNDFRNSFTQDLSILLQEKNIEISIWDPTLLPSDLLGFSQYYKYDLDDRVYDVVVIGNNSEFLFDSQVLNYLRNLPKTTLVVDMWGVTKSLEIKAEMYRFGIGN
jgi:UDP-glucose 6-dehydrogenase